MEPQNTNQKPSKKFPKKFIVIGVAVIVAVVAAVIVALCLKNRIDDTVNEAYFQTNDRRIVDKTDVSESHSIYYGANTIYQVYTIEDNKIIKHEFFYEFGDDYAASKQFGAIKNSAGYNHEIQDVKLYGKYVSLEYYEEEYMYTSPDEVREELRMKQYYKENKIIEEDENEEI